MHLQAQEVTQNSSVSAVGCRCFGMYLDQQRCNFLAKTLIFVMFSIMQISFWVRVAAIDNSEEDLILYNQKI